MDVKNLELKFGGSLENIELETLVEALVGYSTITQEVAFFMYPHTKLNVKVRTPKRGSFIASLDLSSIQQIQSLFTTNNLGTLADILGTVAALYGFKKWLSKNGEPAQIKENEDNTIQIINLGGQITISRDVYNIYNRSPKVRENIRKTFEKLKSQDEIEDFTITDTETKKELFTCNKEDFALLAKQEEEKQRTQVVLQSNQELSVFKVVFKEHYKWEFYYNGNKIFANIEDQIFLRRIEQGEIAFRSGDKLKADVNIKQVFSEAANTFINDSYKIVKVLEHIPRVSEGGTKLELE